MLSNPHAWLLEDLKDVESNGIKVASTFSCGGGSSMGYKRLGCDVVFANDIDPEMAYHYKLNLKPKHHFLCPIKDLITKELPEELYGIDIFEGSPPCSSFSIAGNREKDWGKKKHFREGQTAQVLDDLFFDFLAVAERLKPKVILAENVKGMVIGKAKGYTKLVMQRFREIGYRPQLFLVNAADCGVPQKRERVFFCALRNDIDKPKLELAPHTKWVSAGEATDDLQELTDEEIRETLPTGTDKRFWKLTKPGTQYDSACKKLYGKGSFFNFSKLASNHPSPTLPAKASVYSHWKVMRHLTFREVLRLGSFPDDYQAKTPKIGKYMIGMSVPPKMTEQVAKAVIDQWLT